MTKLHQIVSLKDMPEFAIPTAKMLFYKWGNSYDTYLNCINAYINGESVLGWYICLWKREIVGVIGVISSEFNTRKELSPCLTGLFVKKEHRLKNIEEALIQRAFGDLQKYGISPIYAFAKFGSPYEELGWEKVCKSTSDIGWKGTIYIHN